MNVGGWLLITTLLSILLLLIQRAERKRRIPTAIFALFMAGVVWRYALYRMGGQCDNVTWPTVFCTSPIVMQRAEAIAITTTNWAIIAALVVNFLFWALLGRYNPVGSSDSIRVYGLDMEE